MTLAEAALVPCLTWRLGVSHSLGLTGARYIVHAEFVQCHTNGTARRGARAFCVACGCRMCYADSVRPVLSWATGNLTLPQASELVKPVFYFVVFLSVSGLFVFFLHQKTDRLL